MAKSRHEITITLDPNLSFAREVAAVGLVIAAIRQHAAHAVIVIVEGPEGTENRRVTVENVRRAIRELVPSKRLRRRVHEIMGGRYHADDWPEGIPREEACLLVARAVGEAVARMPEDEEEADGN